MTMQENDTTGVFYARPSVVDEPHGWTRLLCLISVASASITANVIQFVYILNGGVHR